MRELLLILAMSPLGVLAQIEIPAPPEELDQAVRQNPVRISPSPASERIAIRADYSEEALIAGLEGTVRLRAEIAKDGSPANLVVATSLGLGLDERVVSAVQQEWKRMSVESRADLHADFVLPEPRSRWHLVDVAFLPPDGAQRPRFASTTYPTGAGVARTEVLDHAQVVAAAGRQAWVSLIVDLDEHGIPVRFSPLNATHDMWAEQAIAFLREWRFKPALINGKPVASRCALGLAWGSRNIDAYKLAALRAAIERATPLLSSPESRSK